MDPKLEVLTVPAYGIFVLLVLREALSFVAKLRARGNGHRAPTVCCAESIGNRLAASHEVLLSEIRAAKIAAEDGIDGVNEARTTQARYVEQLGSVGRDVADVHHDIVTVQATVSASLAAAQQNGQAIATVQRGVEALLQRPSR